MFSNVLPYQYHLPAEICAAVAATCGLAVSSKHLCRNVVSLCEKWKIPKDVAGASFLSIATAGPEITVSVVASMAGTQRGTVFAVCVMLGSGVIACLLIPGLMSLRSTQPIVLQVEPLFREVRYYFVLIVILSGTTILPSVLWLRLAAAAMVAVYAIYALTLTKEASCSDEEDPLLLIPDGRHLDDSAGSTCSGCTAVSHVTISGLPDLPADDNGTVMAVASFVAWPVDASLNSISPEDHSTHQWLGCFVSVVWMSTSAFILTRVVDGWVTGHPGFVAMFVVSLTAELPDISNALRLASMSESSMAMSNALGAQVANIGLGLGLVWTIQPPLFQGHPLFLQAALAALQWSLLAFLATFVISWRVNGALTRGSGMALLIMYSLVFVALSVDLQCFNQTCSGGSSGEFVVVRVPCLYRRNLGQPGRDGAVAREILTWVQCDKCKKWRRISSAEHLPQRWFCSLNPNPRYNSCDIPAEPESMDMAYTPDSETAQGSPSPFTAASSTPKTEPVAAAATPSREASQSGPAAARKIYTAEYDRARDMLRKLSDKQLEDLSANFVDWPELLELFRRTPREEPEAAPGWAVPPKKLPRRGEAQARADSLHAAAQHYRNSMSLGTVDAQKDEFRKYLEKTGVVSQLTRVLVGLYEEPDRPSDGIDYIKKYLGAPAGIDVDELRAENEDLKRKNANLQQQVDDLVAQLEALKASEDE
ncbi:hypothetical protein FOL46_000496 [Perkinsus olseni]|uniref:CW-type domain-containing protein n=1 Tax=Perkinsus olseni TaxID=32597 RepID=A0A7J6MHW2_PEROL|nr:hypothetical protein FOL46_000496 [Perkinsus olseni]